MRLFIIALLLGLAISGAITWTIADEYTDGAFVVYGTTERQVTDITFIWPGVGIPLGLLFWAFGAAWFAGGRSSGGGF